MRSLRNTTRLSMAPWTVPWYRPLCMRSAGVTVRPAVRKRQQGKPLTCRSCATLLRGRQVTRDMQTVPVLVECCKSSMLQFQTQQWRMP